MNCTGFEKIVNDLAGAKMIDAAARDQAMAHAEACGRCAARLADERALTAGLKSLAASDEERQAPESIEAALLEAVRSRTKPAAHQSFAQPFAQSRGWPRWAWAAAAAILIALGFIVYRSVENEPAKDDVTITEATPTPQPSVEASDRSLGTDRDVVDEKPRRDSGAMRTASRRKANPPKFDRPFIRDSITAYANDTEYTTDFFPLHYDEAQPPMESGELIRVQMPRSALIRFGFPVNVERADAPVKADLLVGEDGLARAIRFIR